MLLHYLGRILNARKYISEVPDSPVSSAAVEHNCQLLAHNPLLENTKSPRFSLRTDYYSISALGSTPDPSKVAANPTVPSLRSPQNTHAAVQIALGNEKHCLPSQAGRAGRGLDTSPSSRHRALAQTHQRRPGLPPYTGVAAHPPTAAEVPCGKERDSTQRGERQAARDGDNKQGLVCCELQARHVNPNRGPWGVYATAPLVQGSSQISPAQYTAIPLESPAVAPAGRLRQGIVDGPHSKLLLGLMF